MVSPKNLLRFENLFVAVYFVALPLAVFAIVKIRMPGVVLIGLLGMAPAILLGRAMWRNAPRIVRLMVWTFAAMAVLMMLPGLSFIAWLPLLLFWIFLYFMRREESRDYAAWWNTQTFSHVPNPPDAILDRLDRGGQWHAYASTFSLADGRTIPFLYWTGLGSTTTMLNAPRGSSHQTRMSHGLLAFSFAARDVGEDFICEDFIREDFIREVEALDPSERDAHPYLTARLPDGHFVVAWRNGKVARLVQARLQTLRALLEKSPTQA